MFKRKRNMNTMDRVARFIVAITLLSVVIFGPLWNFLGFFLIILSGLFLVASFSGFCPFYKSIDVDFNKSDEYFK